MGDSDTNLWDSKIILDAKLIECVKGFDCLYDLESKSYSDPKKKELVWQEIGKTLNKNARDCKKQWHHLRDSFRRVVKQRKIEAFVGSSSYNNKKWRFEDNMQFLTPYIRERNNVPVVKRKKDRDNLSTEQDHSSQHQSEIQHNLNLLLTETNKSKENENCPEKWIEEQIASPISVQDAASLVHHDITKAREKDHRSNDDMDLFFASISATVRKLSAFNQATAKARIFSIVSQLELEELAHGRVQSNHSSSNAPPRGSYYSHGSSLIHPPQTPALDVTRDDEDVKYEHMDFHENYSGNLS